MSWLTDWRNVINGKPPRGDILPTDKHRLEKDVEEKWCKVARSHGWKAYKFSSPGNSSVPDRMFIRDGFVFFIEFKRPGKKATPAQEDEHEFMRKNHLRVHVIDNVEDGKVLIDDYLALD